MARIQARIAFHNMLSKEFDALECGTLCITKAQTAKLFQMAPTATIQHWKKLEGEVNDQDKTDVYELVLQRGAYTLRAVVSITPQYPVRAPNIELSFSAHPAPKAHALVPGVKLDPTAVRLATQSEPTNNNLEAIAAEVNVHFDDLLAGCESEGPVNLLSLQLRRLQMCFDIYVATQLDERSKGGRICFRPERGRARKKPFERQALTGLFDQRR